MRLVLVLVLVLSLAVIGSFVGVLITALQPEPVAPRRWAVAMAGGNGWPEAVPPPHTLRWCPPQARPQLLCQHLDYGSGASVLAGPAALLQPAHDHHPAALRQGDSAACSAWSRHTTTVKNDGSCSRRLDTATRAIPASV
jgi:hypothetical protein